MLPEQRRTQCEQDARRNVRLGWCPCGEEADGDCECFGVDRLSYAQGLQAPIPREREYDQR